ncbi:MAG TPA: alpha/beta hydrolase-fold protein, partial [Myxococcota bacterium]
SDVVTQLGKAQLDIGDRIVVVADQGAFAKASKKSPSAFADHVKYELLAGISDQLPIDLNRIHDARPLGADPQQWAAKVQQSPSSPAHSAGGPVVFADGKWVTTAPTLDYERSFPRVGWGVRGDSAIPREMQKQPADHGTMFVPVIDSKTMDKPFRAGVYLPPGYDPSSSQKLPVLVMLPGKGGALEQWMSAGNITPKLDELMRGDNQKMIVVIPDKTDSLWFDYDKNGEPSVGDKGKRNYEGLLVDEILPFVTRTLNANPDQLSIAGISRGGFGAMSLAARHPGMFKAVSAHSAVLALEHTGGELGKVASGEISKHLGPIDDPIWSQVNPLDLVQAGKLGSAPGSKPPRLLVDIGAEDPYFVDDNLAFGKALADKGIPHEMHVYTGDADMKHNWDTWSTLLPSWISFHQATFGKAGHAEMKSALDVTDMVTSDHADARKKLAGELAERVDAMAQKLPMLSDADRSHQLIGYSEGRRSVYRPLAALQDSIDEAKRDIAALKGKPLHVLEARVPRLEGR